MGAANSNHRAITAFGALNTVIAGILTYLKGSGLPNRIRYYENSWKRVREYIEQRERDFSRQDCSLDVNEIVSTIEAMYEQVKADIQSNTPDNYISVTDMRARATATVPTTPHSTARNKLEELELKYGHKVTDFLESLAHKEEERLKRIETDIDTSKARALAALQEGRHTVLGTQVQLEKELEDAKVGVRDWSNDMQNKGVSIAERELSHARNWEKGLEQNAARSAQREIEHARSSLVSRVQPFAQDLEQTKADVMNRSDDVPGGLDAVKASAIQQHGDSRQHVQEKTARFAETGRELERDVEQARVGTQRAGESIDQAGDTLQRAGDRVLRGPGAVDGEIRGYRKD
jgi:hypothetical protein